MKIYTKKGDKGLTGLFNGKRLPKKDHIFEVLGEFDEFNARLGLVIVQMQDDSTKKHLLYIQHQIMNICSWIATPNPNARQAEKLPKIGENLDKELEKRMDAMTKELPPLTNFILPGGNEVSARIHSARTSCRKCERYYYTQEWQNAEASRFINRLSDYLFTLARWFSPRNEILHVAKKD